jgi:hypothetical protein
MRLPNSSSSSFPLFLSACAIVVMGAGEPPPKSATADATGSASKPMVTQNPDGTITVQKQPPKGNSKDAKGKNGLIIPAQVVAPTNAIHEEPHGK